MATRDQPGNGWTVVLRRQSARMVKAEVAPELQRVRGPYPIAAGITAYVMHLRLYHQPARATSMAR